MVWIHLTLTKESVVKKIKSLFKHCSIFPVVAKKKKNTISPELSAYRQQLENADTSVEYDQMLYDYGNKVKWVDVRLHLTYSEVEELFGERCESYEHSCPVCKNWTQWDETGTATLSLLRNEVIELLRK